MIRVGVLGFGFMGRMHFNCYAKRSDVCIVAICDTDLSGIQNPELVGNLPLEQQNYDLSSMEVFSDFEQMLRQAELDVVSITLPTHLHPEYTCRALQAGIHVLCEKPMALDIVNCDRMIKVARNSGKYLQIGHCIRFFPQYTRAKEIVESNKYGGVLAASFRRLSAPPTWSKDNWLENIERSGGMELDLHIHDTDFVQYLLGQPKAVHSVGYQQVQGGLGYITTQYEYENGIPVSAEGSWLLQPSFGFEMSFLIQLEKATLVFDSTHEPNFRIYQENNEPFTPDFPSEDGYTQQIDHFIRVISGEKVSEIINLESSRDAVRIVEAERLSAMSGKRVQLDWS